MYFNFSNCIVVPKDPVATADDFVIGYLLERVTGIGPAYPAWKAGVLPLNYTRKSSIG